MVALFTSHNRLAALAGAQKFMIAGVFNSLFSIGTEGTAEVAVPVVAVAKSRVPPWYLILNASKKRGGSCL